MKEGLQRTRLLRLKVELVARTLLHIFLIISLGNNGCFMVHAWQSPGHVAGAYRSPLFSASASRARRQATSACNSLAQMHEPSLWKSLVSVTRERIPSRNMRTRLGQSAQLYGSSSKEEKLSQKERQGDTGKSNIYDELSEEELRYQLDQLKQENQLLLETINKLEDDNAALSLRTTENDIQPRIILETFEGEGDEWCDSLEEGACPLEPTVSYWQALRERAVWLIGLLLLQSFSGIILSRNESLISNHPEIVYFLTMLVGAGGNAGNQASVRVIRGLALRTLNPSTQGQFLVRELKMAISLSSLLTSAGFLRAMAFSTPFPETIAITSALFLIVFSSICLGAVLPLALKRAGVDPAHSSTSIQVIMDILGVFLAVGVSNLLLDSPLGIFVISKLTGS